MPAVYILYFVEEYIFYVNTIYLIDAREYRVQVLHLHISQAVVVEVGVAILYVVLQQYLVTKRRLSASSYSDNHLGKWTVKLE